jgi:two-component system chemotaxis sensor kinase CheA
MNQAAVALEKTEKLLRFIGLELAFVDPRAQKPADELRKLLVQLLEAVDAGAPEHIRALTHEACRLVEPAAGGTVVLSGETITQLHDWQPRMEEAVIAWSRQRPAAAAAMPHAASAPPPAAAGAAAGKTPVDAATKVSPPPPQAAPAPPTAPAHPLQPAVAAAASGPSAEAESVSILPADADPEMMRLFCAESQDLLRDIEQGVLVLEEQPGDADTLATVFRAFHTFKGNASVMKLVAVQRVAHELESLLDAARRGSLLLDRAAIDLILAGADLFERFIAEMTAQVEGVNPGRQIPLPMASVIERAKAVLAGRPAAQPAAAARAVAATVTAAAHIPAVAPIAMPAAPVGIPPTPFTTAVHPAAAAAAEPVRPAAPDQNASAAVPQPAPPPAPQPAEPTPARPVPGAGMIRVDTLKLDGLIDLVGELVISQSMIMQNPALQTVTNEQLTSCLGQLRGITSELQQTALSLRMVPVRTTFQKMARLVRDLSQQVGKEIRLTLDGEDTEIDRTIVEELSDPLVHMIRNAADHGVEPPADRIAAGKDAAGAITLRAFHKGGAVVIQIQDDGRGLSVTRIRQKAIERGLITSADALSDREVLDLIFAPGFSLAARVTDLSGRGVGMDVVRRNIERLRGTIEIDSMEGRGTTFTITVPLTLAIIEGLLVKVGDERFIVPTLSVRESFRPLPEMISVVQGRGEMVSVRGRLTPLLRLGDHLRIRADVTDPAQGIVMVLEAGQDSRCVLVDALVGKQEVVIKSLGETFRDRQEFAGAAILGDGRVGLILDASGLVRLKPRHPEAA